MRGLNIKCTLTDSLELKDADLHCLLAEEKKKKNLNKNVAGIS